MQIGENGSRADSECNLWTTSAFEWGDPVEFGRGLFMLRKEMR